MIPTPLAQEATDSIPDQVAAWLNLEAFKKRWATLLGDTPPPTRTEVDELLLRHYAEDTSLFTLWSSWWHDLPNLHKGVMVASITSVAGLVGAIIGLAFPFAALASGILFAAHKLLMDHEEHRRSRGERFVKEIRELTQKMDGMLSSFKVIAADMLKALEKVQVQAADLLKTNAAMSLQVGALNKEQEALQTMIATLREQAEQMQKVHNHVVEAVESVATTFQSVSTGIEHTTVKVQNLGDAITQFEDITVLVHQTESNIKKVSSGLNSFIQQASNQQSKVCASADPEFDKAMQLSEKAIAAARAKRALSHKTMDDTYSMQH